MRVDTKRPVSLSSVPQKGGEDRRRAKSFEAQVNGFPRTGVESAMSLKEARERMESAFQTFWRSGSGTDPGDRQTGSAADKG